MFSEEVGCSCFLSTFTLVNRSGIDSFPCKLQAFNQQSPCQSISPLDKMTKFAHVFARISQTHCNIYMLQLQINYSLQLSKTFLMCIMERTNRDLFREMRGSEKARDTFRNSRESRLSMWSENTASRVVAADCDSGEIVESTLDPVSNYLRKSLKPYRDAGMTCKKRSENW